MRVACAQVNPTVGDIRGNTELALRAIERANEEGVGILLLPELMLTGYPPEDLLLKDHFVEENLDALEWVAGACGHLTVVGIRRPRSRAAVQRRRDLREPPGPADLPQATAARTTACSTRSATSSQVRRRASSSSAAGCSR